MTANINPTAMTDGVVYGTNVPLTPTEASLGGGTTPDPIPVVEGQTIFAIVKVTVQGHVSGNNSYIFLQTDLGDGTWVDVAWCQITNTDIGPNNPKVFMLCGGGLGAMNNSLSQRNAGATPAVQGNGSNAIPLGGRCRFSGFLQSSGGSSSLAGTPATVLATITYRLQTPR